jgi:hypothetical protein
MKQNTASLNQPTLLPFLHMQVFLAANIFPKPMNTLQQKALTL